VLIDIYSRFNPSWILSPVEDSQLATDFIAEAITRNGATPHTVHADRGTSMTRSHSRPRVSNDNPFSEAQFKTLKYLSNFPVSFTSLAAPASSTPASSTSTTVDPELGGHLRWPGSAAETLWVRVVGGGEGGLPGLVDRVGGPEAY